MVHELAADGIDVAVACRMLKVWSGYHEWRGCGPSDRDVDDGWLADQVRDIHAASRGCYGAPRVHAELRLGQGVCVGRQRVARLLRLVGRAGIGGATHRRRRRRAEATLEDLLQRKFVATAPNHLWCIDITEHPTATGKVYGRPVLDVISRVVVGWSIADHIRSELVVDALQMAYGKGNPKPARSFTRTEELSTPL